VSDECTHALPLEQSIKLYVEKRVPVGDFLTALLSNNLVETVARADQRNGALLKEYAEHLYWCLPGNCWGSPEKVKRWLGGSEDAA